MRIKSRNSLNPQGSPEKQSFEKAIQGQYLQGLMAKCVPDARSAKQLTADLLSIVTASEKLRECEPITVLTAALRGAAMGLMLGEEYYVVPFKSLDELPADLFSNSEDTNPTETEPSQNTEPGKFTYGDVDMSGKIDILDVITLNRSLLGKETLTKEQQDAADVDLSGKPDASDSLNIMKYIVGLVTEFPIKR